MAQNIKARAGAGSSLSVGDGASPEVFTKVGQILTLKRSGRKIKTADVTNQDSATDANGTIYEELIGTIASGGTVDLTMNYVPSDAAQRTFQGLFDRKPHNFKMATPNDPASSPVVPYATFSFAALLLDGPDLDLPLDKQMMLTVKLTIVGADNPIVYSS